MSTSLFDTRHAVECEPAPPDMTQATAALWVLVVVLSNGDCEVIPHLENTEAEAEIQAEFFRKQWLGVTICVVPVTIVLPCGTRLLESKLKSKG